MGQACHRKWCFKPVKYCIASHSSLHSSGFVRHVTAGSNVKINTRSYLFQYLHSTFRSAQKKKICISWDKWKCSPGLLNHCRGSELPAPSDSYLVCLLQLASWLQRESHASLSVLLKTQTCPALLRLRLPQNAGKTQTGPKRVAW